MPGTREDAHAVGEKEVREGLGEAVEDSGGHVKMVCWWHQATERQWMNLSKRVWGLSISSLPYRCCSGVWDGTSYESTVREEKVAGLYCGSGTGQKRPTWDTGEIP